LARIELSTPAVDKLDRLITTHSLPADTRSRVARSLRSLADFSLMGRSLEREWSGFRFILGPWPWLLIIYIYDQEEDRVLVVTIQDARSSSASTASR
jgi:plasmid stabilization system protein ParE